MNGRKEAGRKVQETHGERYRYRAIGSTEKMGDKVFHLRLPVDVETYLLSLPGEERVKLIRGAVVNEARRLIAHPAPDDSSDAPSATDSGK